MICESKALYKDNIRFRFLIPLIVSSYFNGGFDQVATTNALPEIQKEYNLDVSLTSWCITVGSIIKAVLSIPLSQLSAKTGVIKANLFFIGCMVLLFPLHLFMRSFAQILILRGLVNICICGALVNNQAIYQQLPPEELRKKYTQYQQITMNIARIFGPLISTTVIQYAGWRWCYVICTVFALTRFIYVLCIYKLSARYKNFDFGGAIFLTAFMLCFCLFLTYIAQYQLIYSALLFLLFIILLTAFIIYEKDEEDPIIDIKTIKKPVPTLLLIQFFQAGILQAEQTIVPQYFSLMGIDTIYLGVVNSSRLLITLFGTISSIYLTNKYDQVIIMKISLIICVSFMLIITFTNNYIWVYVIFFIINSFPTALYGQVLTPTIMISVEADLIHKINGIHKTTGTLAQSISNCVITMLWKLSLDTLQLQYVMYICYGFISLMLIVNLILVFSLRPVRKSNVVANIV